MALLSKAKTFYKINRYQLMKKKGAYFVLAAFIGGSCIIAISNMAFGFVPYVLKGSQTPSADSTEETPSYIYLSADRQGIVPHFGEMPNRSTWWPWRTTQSHLYWKLLKLTKSKDQNVRHTAVKALAMMPNLDESQHRMVAQASEIRTVVGLARTSEAHPDLFLPPPFKHSKKGNLETEFQLLFASLPQKDVSQCIQYFTKHITGHRFFNFFDSGEVEFLANIGEADESILHHHHRRLPSAMYQKFCLEALLGHSFIPNHRSLMVQNGALQLLHQVLQLHQDSVEVKSLIAKIIGNIALEDTLHKQIFVAGWVGVLSSWLKSPFMQLNLPAAKALANMDRDYSDIYFEDGIYPLHPQFRGKENGINADVVFIHGLLGGAFKTWRQHDSKKTIMKTSNDKTDSTHMCHVKPSQNTESDPESDATHHIVQELNANYTPCWPKDWLAKDCPHLRLIAVDYNTYVSEWKAKCPEDKKKHDLRVRSRETLKKLVASGIGNRPIVWVSHSMGGLLVKQMLVDAAADEEPSIRSVAKKTAGVVFYSVPHKGSELANFRQSAEIIFQPSIEVQQLKKNSPELIKLNQDFKDLVQKQNIASLSFGETKKSKLGLHWSSILVTADSSNPDFGEFCELPVDHLNTCKPESRNSPIYGLLLNFLHATLPAINSFYVNDSSNKCTEMCIIMGLIH